MKSTLLNLLISLQGFLYLYSESARSHLIEHIDDCTYMIYYSCLI